MTAPSSRLAQLLALAGEGDEAAIHDLFAEYDYDASSPSGGTHLPLTEETQETHNQHEEK